MVYRYEKLLNRIIVTVCSCNVSLSKVHAEVEVILDDSGFPYVYNARNFDLVYSKFKYFVSMVVNLSLKVLLDRSEFNLLDKTDEELLLDFELL